MKKLFFVLSFMATTTLTANAIADDCPTGVCSNGYTCTCYGNLITEKVKNDGTSKLVYTYDAAGNTTSTTVWNDTSSTPSYQYRYLRDENGKILASTKFEGNDLINNIPTEQDRYTYDADGHQTARITYRGQNIATNSTPTYVTLWTYNDDSRMTAETFYYNGSSVPYAQWRYAYDENGRRISRTEYATYNQMSSGTSDKQYIYTYDDSGKSTTTTLQCSHGDTCQPVKFSCTESHCSTTYTDNIVAFDYTTLPTIVCVKGYYNGCTGYSEDAATFDYYTNARSFICTIGYIEGCTVDKSTPTINSNTLSEGGTDSSAGSGKRIYTVEEARAAVEAAGTDTVNFRIRYK